VTWAYESQMDMIAERLGLDPLEFRLKNLLKKGESTRSAIRLLIATSKKD